MTYEEFTEKVGTISLLVDDDEYTKIFFDYQKSALDKDDFLKNWREQKIQALKKKKN